MLTAVRHALTSFSKQLLLLVWAHAPAVLKCVHCGKHFTRTDPATDDAGGDGDCVIGGGGGAAPAQRLEDPPTLRVGVCWRWEVCLLGVHSV